MRPDPIVLTREQHIAEIFDFWTQKRIDADAADVLFDAQLRQVAFAMAEQKLRPTDKAVAAFWGGYLFFLAFFGLMIWEMIRP